MSVLDNVTLAPRKVLGRSRAEAEREALALLERFGLGAKARRRTPTGCRAGSSSGWRSCGRSRCSRTCCCSTRSPRALDPELVAEVLDVIRELAAGGMTMLIATHEMGFARDIANRVCFLDEGRILEQGPPAQIFAEPREARTRQFLTRIIEAGRL